MLDVRKVLVSAITQVIKGEVLDSSSHNIIFKREDSKFVLSFPDVGSDIFVLSYILKPQGENGLPIGGEGYKLANDVNSIDNSNVKIVYLDNISGFQLKVSHDANNALISFNNEDDAFLKYGAILFGMIVAVYRASVLISDAVAKHFNSEVEKYKKIMRDKNES